MSAGEDHWSISLVRMFKEDRDVLVLALRDGWEDEAGNEMFEQMVNHISDDLCTSRRWKAVVMKHGRRFG